MALSAIAMENSDSTRLTFPQSHSELITNFGENASHLRTMSERMRSLTGGRFPLYRVDSVRVVGGASPEGTTAINDTLSRRRAAIIFDYFRPDFASDDVVTSFRFLGRDWSGLKEMVESDHAVPYREEVLSLLTDIISSPSDDGTLGLQSLKDLRGGVPYSYMYSRLFPGLRESSIYIDYSDILPPFSSIVSKTVVATEIAEFIYSPIPLSDVRAYEGRPFYMAIKSNMLYDVMALPSIGAEFYIGRNFSIVGNWTYGWWDKDSSHRYWRAYGGDLAIRKWFGRAAAEKPLTGHHIGIYGGVFTYDFEFGGKGYMGGLPGRPLWDRCLLNAGIEYGYSLPIARRLNIDFTIGLGTIYGKYIKYVPQGNGYHYESTHNLRWFGPAKAEVSLVWLIGNGNFNKAKGGRR